MIKRTIPDYRLAPFTGKAPCEPATTASQVGRGYLELTGYGEKLRLR